MFSSYNDKQSATENLKALVMENCTMKVLSIGFTILSTLAIATPQTHAGSCTPPPSGLVSWWPAEGNANDIVGTNNGSLIGNVSFTNGEVGHGFYFDGGVDGIVVPDAPELNFNSNQDLSIDAWIQPLTQPGNDYDVIEVLDKRVAPTFNVQLGYDLFLEGGVLSFQMADVLAINSFNNFSAGPDLRDGKFHHVAVTVQRNSTTGGRFYIDGQLAGTFDPTVCPGDLSNTGSLLIGSHPTPGFHGSYHGIIDELSLYRRALGSNEISAIYNAGSAGKCPNNCTPPPSDIISWWPAEETTDDIIGTNSGTAMGSLGYTYGIVGRAFSLDGVSSYVLIPNSVSMNPPGPFTIEGWIYPTKDADQKILSKWGDQGIYENNRSYALKTTPGLGLALTISDLSNQWDSSFQEFTVTGVLTLNAWNHVAGTYDSGTGIRCLYVNGVNVGSHTNAAVPVYDSIGPVTIGTFLRSPDYNQDYFQGLIDELSLYNRALSSTEIQLIYNAGSAGKCVPGSSGVPVISQFTPASGTNGATVTISGINFSPVAGN